MLGGSDVSLILSASIMGLKVRDMTEPTVSQTPTHLKIQIIVEFLFHRSPFGNVGAYLIGIGVSGQGGPGCSPLLNWSQ